MKWDYEQILDKKVNIGMTEILLLFFLLFNTVSRNLGLNITHFMNQLIHISTPSDIHSGSGKVCSLEVIMLQH